MVEIEELRNIKYFKKLSEDKIKELSNICNIKVFKKGEIVFYEGESANFLYYLKNGAVNVFKSQSDLKQIHITTFSSNLLIAEMTMFEGIDYPATVEACSQKVELIEIDLKKFKENFLTDPNTLLEMLKSLTMKINRLMHSIDMETSTNIDIKISKYILENEHIIHSIKHRQMAMELNTTPETLSRILKRMQQNGILESTNPIVIKNKCKLCKNCGPCSY